MTFEISGKITFINMKYPSSVLKGFLTLLFFSDLHITFWLTCCFLTLYFQFNCVLQFFVTLSNSHAGFVFCLPFKCTFISFISFMSLPKQPVEHSKQLLFYLTNINGSALQTGLSWGFLLLVQPGTTHADALALLGPQSYAWLSDMMLTLSWTPLFTWYHIFKEMRSWASSPTAVFQDDDSRSYKIY